MELVIFVGLQAAGKSTFYRQRFAATHGLVSKDLLRNNRNSERQQLNLIAEALAADLSVVVDNTNPTPAERQPLIAQARVYGATVTGYSFESRLGACLARNKQRVGRGRVPDIALFATAKRLVLPTYDEGFDRLYTVRIGDDGTFVVADLLMSTSGLDGDL